MIIDKFKKCLNGHTGIRNAKGECVECVNVRTAAYAHTPAGKVARARSQLKQRKKEAAASEYNHSVRRAIEDKRDSEMN
jgi:hypothetical protein